MCTIVQNAHEPAPHTVTNPLTKPSLVSQMFRHYQLRTPSVSNASSRASTLFDTPGRSLRATSNSRPPQPALAPQDPQAADSNSDLEEPLASRVLPRVLWRSIEHDPMILTPRHTKQLKIFAKDVCVRLDIPDKSLMEFIEVTRLFI